MPYSLKVEGMAEISEALEKLEQDAPAVAAKAVYIGAGIVQKAVLDEMNKIKTAPFSYAKDGQQRLPSPEEKEILVQAGVGGINSWGRLPLEQYRVKAGERYFYYIIRPISN